jgi:hypothetical protein
MNKLDYPSMLHFFVQRSQPFYSPMRKALINKKSMYISTYIYRLEKSITITVKYDSE